MVMGLRSLLLASVPLAIVAANLDDVSALLQQSPAKEPSSLVDTPLMPASKLYEMNHKVQGILSKTNERIGNATSAFREKTTILHKKLSKAMVDRFTSASSKMAAQLMKGMQDRVRHEVELATAASAPKPASLLAEEAEVQEPAESNASAVVEEPPAASTSAESLGLQPPQSRASKRSSVFNKKVSMLKSRVNKALTDMKDGLRELSRGINYGVLEASERIASQLADSVHEHVRQEIELARAAEPAS
mmetsp:Transcript_47235/g.109276  ORF Transcript_47235/g.109276 Transcript_47235/m.109276 type:complete len:247 (-) Transcript_47235:80-820(-)|eukprot:CAMPEP_0171106844 /NCGR_PEP_ID=MMETSP0766_2-20121228/65650_1 /TAXON_ID=439317 /ORGANISM="Gambierdiscus australes, Strain CAWD 149" /LENGTH=246 /DNA_ID=CAMNT_0011568039 /DNA_START=72 /DNA_END=812 /DNA_ORIENTATION=-